MKKLSLKQIIDITSNKNTGDDVSFNNKPDVKGLVNEAFENVTPYSDRASTNQRPITEEEIAKLTNEVSSASMKRMQGLVNINDIKSLRKIVGSIADDMEDEGFEADETRDFILKYVDAVLRNY